MNNESFLIDGIRDGFNILLLLEKLTSIKLIYSGELGGRNPFAVSLNNKGISFKVANRDRATL